MLMICLVQKSRQVETEAAEKQSALERLQAAGRSLTDASSAQAARFAELTAQLDAATLSLAQREQALAEKTELVQQLSADAEKV